MFTHSYNNIITLENLLSTWNRFIRGKRHKKDVMEYELNLSNNLIQLHQILKNKKYQHAEYSAFHISDPKPRSIHKATVQDRLVHHLLYKELYWYFDSKFIHDSYSCRVNKGVHRANDRFKKFAGKVSRNNTRTCYILKCDIKKFFASVDHKILKNILRRHVQDKDILNLIFNIIDSFYSTRKGVGLPLGNLTSQLLVNVYMHEFDMYIKQELRTKYYIRYADDFVIMSQDRKYLEKILIELEKFLKQKLNLFLHDHKLSIETYSSGVDFLGWVHFPYHKQLRTITKRNIVRKLHKHVKPETVASYRGLLSHGDTYKFKKYIKMRTDIEL
jgi:retron-type reverse transcriptase